MEKMVTQIILSMEEPFTFQDVRDKAKQYGVVDEMAILSIMSKLGDEGIMKSYHYNPREKVHRYVIEHKL